MEKSQETCKSSPGPDDLGLSNLSINIREESPETESSHSTVQNSSSTAKGLPPRAASLSTSPRQEEKEKEMFAALGAIFQHAQDIEGGYALSAAGFVPGDDNWILRNVQSRAGALRDVRATLDQLWWMNSQFMPAAAEILADASRDPQGTKHGPDDTVVWLLGLASEPDTDLDDFVALVNLVVAYLADERFQRHLLIDRYLEKVLAVLVGSYSRTSTPETSAPTTPSASAPDISDPPPTSEAEQLLSPMRNALNHVLSDISALPEFAYAYPLESPLVGSLRLWLSVSQPALQVCACIMLGNLARSDEVCSIMVQNFNIHEPLIKSLSETADPQVLHAVASFLKNLSLMPTNKDCIGKAGIIEAMSRLWSMETLPQVQYSGAALARQVVNGSYSNVLRLLTPLSMDPDSPAHSRTYLSVLLRLCEKTDQESTTMEIARLVTAVCRTLSSAKPSVAPQEVERTQLRLFGLHADVARPLCNLVLQSKWPVLRSEGWFAFALMAGSEQGAAAVGDVFDNVDVFRALVDVVTGQQTREEEEGVEGPENAVARESSEAGSASEDPKAAEMKKIDRDNGRVLISKLLENRGEEMTTMRKRAFEDLLQGRAYIHRSFSQLIEGP
ncbi:MAG: hypothetical protein M1833_002431 [Piccolia ochrophora]|nr:MAG: hypothetical protein M1833_002431 [Piccolia ochrophora]